MPVVCCGGLLAVGLQRLASPPPCAGVLCVLRWLSFTAPLVGEPPAQLSTADPVDRPIGYAPAEGRAVPCLA